MKHARNISELVAAGYKSRSIKDELRENLLAKLRRGENLFPGIHAYEETVIPKITNAILSRHNLILLGLRGQAKSRMVRALGALLDPEIPVISNCEINDDPLAPICKSCRERFIQEGDAVEIRFIPRHQRYIEKLATPDVTIADIIGDIDPIKAARSGLSLSDELTIHFGLLPRANRGIFAINELADLAPKIQVGLFNIMEERDLQIRGYPVRLPLDVFLVFTANPEDYTTRGKIITPLKDRIGSEIRTHYPATVDDGIRITAQEAWTDRSTNGQMTIPGFIRELVEEIAFQAREHPMIDKQSGVSQRMPITSLENIVSNAERRVAELGNACVVPNLEDVYFSIPAITGKLELEYEGEVQGSESIAHELIQSSISKVFKRYLQVDECKEIVAWFEEGHLLEVPQAADPEETLALFEGIPNLLCVSERFLQGLEPTPELRFSAAGLVLEGLSALKKLQRRERQKKVRFRAVRRKILPHPQVN